MEAFVYCWTDNITKKLYVGVHKGTIDDGYICSSKIFLSEYKTRPETFTRKIVAMGTYEDMYSLETKILQTENVINNDGYYNIAMNNGYFKNKGLPLTEEHKNNIKKSAPKGENHPMFGKKHDLKTKNKMSDSRKKYMMENNISMKKENHPMFGKKHSEEHKEKIKKALQGKKRSEQAKNNAGEGRSGFYKITTPEGCELIIRNLSKFCKEHGLHMSNLWNRGINKKYKCEHLDKFTFLNKNGN
jgi:hypothetical protein